MQQPAAPGAPVLCIHCTYDLTGLAAEGNCPECGLPVERSIQGDLLLWRQPKYVAKLHVGAILLQASLAMIVLSFLLVFALSLLNFNSRAGSDIFSALASATGALGSLLGALLYPIGWWMLSARDPGRLDDAQGQRSRKLVRISVLGTLLSMILLFVLALNSIGGRHTTSTGWLPSVAFALAILMVLAWIVQFYASMLYLRWLAQRIPNRKVFKRAKLMMWLGPVLLLLSCTFVLPLIVGVVYYSMLSIVRQELKQIRRKQAALQTDVLE